MTFILKLGAARGALLARPECRRARGALLAATAIYEETSEGRSECRSAPLPAARAPWLLPRSAPPVRRRAPRSSALQQPPHSR